jgi:hypothetical protein
MDGERRWGDAMTRVEAWKFLAQVLENSQTQTYAMFLQRAVENAGYQKGEEEIWERLGALVDCMQDEDDSRARRRIMPAR